MFFYDHSSGHGAYSKDALLARNGHKGPDWTGTVASMRDGWFLDTHGVRRKQAMNFKEGDVLPIDVTCPPGIDANADANLMQQEQQASLLRAPPPTAAETEMAYKLFYQGRLQTLKKRNAGKTSAELEGLGRSKWLGLTSDEQLVYVTRMRMRSNTSTQTAAARIIKAGSPVPRVLWGRHKGLEVVLRERGLYPSNGLKGACSSAKACTSNCCCAKVLSAQADFLEERSALQHLVEERVQLAGRNIDDNFTPHLLLLAKIPL